MRIKKRVAELEKDRQVDFLQDKPGKEEQRAETFHAQLSATMEKETTLQARVDQLDERLRPGNIERSLAGVGGLHPEDAREALFRPHWAGCCLSHSARNRKLPSVTIRSPAFRPSSNG
jgi:hypothetical protein